MIWTEIIVHHSASPDSDDPDTPSITRWHVEGRGWSDVGYHFLVELVDGKYEVCSGRPLAKVGAHCIGHNKTGIGVCFVGDFSSRPVPEAQMQAGAELIARLMHEWNIPIQKVSPHKKFWATACPGERFDITLLRQMVLQIGAE